MFRTTTFETLTKGEKIREDGLSPQPSAQHPSPLTFLYSNLGSILPEPIIGLIQEYYVATPKEVTAFLKLVAEGEQDKAEALLQNNLALALVPGDVTDLSKRTFTNITGFQYAVWALDWHMWTMIRKYLPDEAAKAQAEEFETGAWVRQHGIHAQHLLDNLVKALQTTIDLYDASKFSEGDTAWVQQVGGAQLMLPAHVVNEYCHPTRLFSYDPFDFRDAATLPRTRSVLSSQYWSTNHIDAQEWFTGTYYNGGKLGTEIAFYRGDAELSARWCGGRQWDGIYWCVCCGLDHYCIRNLTNVRTAQREELVNELKPKSVQRKTA